MIIIHDLFFKINIDKKIILLYEKFKIKNMKFKFKNDNNQKTFLIW